MFVVFWFDWSLGAAQFCLQAFWFATPLREASSKQSFQKSGWFCEFIAIFVKCKGWRLLKDIIWEQGFGIWWCNAPRSQYLSMYWPGTKVLLYNFFEDSTVSFAQWRVVLNALESASDLLAPAPRFSETRHAGICSEVCFSLLLSYSCLTKG